MRDPEQVMVLLGLQRRGRIGTPNVSIASHIGQPQYQEDEEHEEEACQGEIS